MTNDFKWINRMPQDYKLTRLMGDRQSTWGDGIGDRRSSETFPIPMPPYYPPQDHPGEQRPIFPDIIIDHARRQVLDTRPSPQTEPKLIVELTADAKDVVIQCRCGEKISLTSLLGIEAVKPIFDGISNRIKGLIEGMESDKSGRQ